MCSSHLLNVIEKVIGDEVIKRTSFTTYDITTKVRALTDWGNEEVKHYQVRRDIHRLARHIVDDGTYEMTIQDFNGKTALLYKPIPITVNQNNDISSATITSNVPFVQTLYSVQKTLVTMTYRTLNTDKRGSFAR